jgi:DNA polymerase
MPVVKLASEIDFAGWRRAARALRACGAAPCDVLWTVDPAGDLFDDAALEPREAGAFNVPREFVVLAQAAILHRSDERFALLYRMLWRLAAEPMLLWVADADADRARDFATGVGKAVRAMQAGVRFQPAAGPAPGEPATLIAWFAPAHRVTQCVAPGFARRHAAQRFELMTPDACAHWDGRRLAYTPGVDPADAPGAAALPRRQA